MSFTSWQKVTRDKMLLDMTGSAGSRGAGNERMGWALVGFSLGLERRLECLGVFLQWTVFWISVPPLSSCADLSKYISWNFRFHVYKIGAVTLTLRDNCGSTVLGTSLLHRQPSGYCPCPIAGIASWNYLLTVNICSWMKAMKI